MGTEDRPYKGRRPITQGVTFTKEGVEAWATFVGVDEPIYVRAASIRAAMGLLGRTLAQKGALCGETTIDYTTLGKAFQRDIRTIGSYWACARCGREGLPPQMVRLFFRDGVLVAKTCLSCDVEEGW